MKPRSTSGLLLVLAAALLLPACDGAPAVACRPVGENLTGAWLVQVSGQAGAARWQLSQCAFDLRGGEVHDEVREDQLRQVSLALQGSFADGAFRLSRTPAVRGEPLNYEGVVGADGRLRGMVTTRDGQMTFTATRTE